MGDDARIQYRPHENCAEVVAFAGSDPLGINDAAELTCDDEAETSVPLHVYDPQGGLLTLEPGWWLVRTSTGLELRRPTDG